MLEKLHEIKENEAHIWFGKITTEALSIQKFHNLLSPDERERAIKFKFAKHRNQFTWCRGLLRYLSGHYLNVLPESILFKYGEYGKPYYDISTTLKFNVSHSGIYGLLGFSLNAELGVDIEEIKPHFNVLEIAQNFFSELEIKTLKKISSERQNEAFYSCWTRKEAFIKAKTQGLTFPLKSFSVSLDSVNSAKLIETKWNIEEKKRWNLYSFKPSEKYIAAICTNKDIIQIHCYNWDILF